LTLQQRIGDLTGDPDNRRWSTSKVQAKIEEGQEHFVSDTRVLTDNTTDSIVSGTAEYTLPTDTVDILTVSANYDLLKRISKYDLYIEAGNDWQDDTGSPTNYYIDIDPNNQKLGLYPIPEGGDAGTNNLRIEYIKMPPALTGDSSVPFDGHTLLYPYHMAIAYWAAADLLRVYPTQEHLAMIAEYRKEYDKFVSDCIETFNHMAASTPMRMRGGRYFKGL
jgi:hypothetical protein